MPTFGERFKELRLDKKMKQEELINDFNKKFHYSFTKSAVSQYENDKRIPEIQALNDFAEYFGVSVDYLLGRNDNSTIMIDEPEVSLHEECARIFADRLEKNGYTLNKNILPYIINYAEYMLDKDKKQDD